MAKTSVPSPLAGPGCGIQRYFGRLSSPRTESAIFDYRMGLLLRPEFKDARLLNAYGNGIIPEPELHIQFVSEILPGIGAKAAQKIHTFHKISCERKLCVKVYHIFEYFLLTVGQNIWKFCDV